MPPQMASDILSVMVGQDLLAKTCGPTRSIHTMGAWRMTDFGSSTLTATYRGTVVRSEWHNDYGNVVVIQHDLPTGTVYSFYGHMASRAVAVGNSVETGTAVGVIGETGAICFGVHVHFAVSIVLGHSQRLLRLVLLVS